MTYVAEFFHKFSSEGRSHVSHVADKQTRLRPAPGGLRNSQSSCKVYGKFTHSIELIAGPTKTTLSVEWRLYSRRWKMSNEGGKSIPHLRPIPRELPTWPRSQSTRKRQNEHGFENVKNSRPCIVISRPSYGPTSCGLGSLGMDYDWRIWSGSGKSCLSMRGRGVGLSMPGSESELYKSCE
jgi:hypothetical protein